MAVGKPRRHDSVTRRAARTARDGETVLPDLLASGLVTVFCGSAVGAVSARLGAPYAGPGNKFWPTLAETGLTPRRFEPHEWRALVNFGIGLTDLNKTQSGSDASLSADADDPDAFVGKILDYRPRRVAFTAKRPAAVLVRHLSGRTPIAYGVQPEKIGDTELFVLPSPSGLAVRFWDPAWWHALAALHRAPGARSAVSARRG
jgi:mismatch-specific thymine-DNA glycosylase